MEARKQGIVLKEDFSLKESEMFTADYFKVKAFKSLKKSSERFSLWPDVSAFVAQFSNSV